MNNTYQITIEDFPDANEVGVLLKGLHDYNTEFSGQGEARYIALFLRDNENAVVGGVFGWTAFEWLKIDVLWVREDLRGLGYGLKLLSAVEGAAIERGCKYSTLDSFSFQAPAFYQRYGYSEFAVLDKIAGNQTWHFLKKELQSFDS